MPRSSGLLLAILPPGAFIGLGLLIAGRNWLNSRLAKPEQRHAGNEQPSLRSPKAA